ncbi:MAG: glycosyltransferase [Nitrospirae bacterium]|nr:glycosyltransferase [Nitrospirota bacterium]
MTDDHHVYIVQSGDSFWSIFISLNRAMVQWPEFLEANRHFTNPDRIFPGDEVVIPDGWVKTAGGRGGRPEVASARETIAVPDPNLTTAVRSPAATDLPPDALSLPAAEVQPPLSAPSPEPVGIDSKPFMESWMNYVLSIVLVVLAIVLSKKRIRFSQTKWAIVALSLFLGLRYLYWRGAYTFNTEDAWSTSISLILYLAEIYGFLSVLLFYVQVAQPTDRAASPPNEAALPMVDVFVTTYNESPDLLYRTLVGCAAMDYPAGCRTIYVLDDGQREEVKRLAERLGCHYLARATHEHAKAGNLNHALTQSSGEFVMVLDCDHIPVRTFLKETIGFFKEPDVAFVQTPHYFYNPDTFQRNLRLEREIVNEQDLFFYVIEPGRDGSNSSFFAGSGGIFRRSALQSIGGFQVLTLTEDLHTSMVLHAKGHRSVYLNKILAAGLSPESYRSYLKQRQRWTRGGIQVFLLDNPLWKSGLTFMQRINYFGSIFYFFHGWPRLVYLSAPLAFLLFQYAPMITSPPVLLNYFLPYYITSLMAFNLISRGFRNPFWSDVYETVMCFFISWTTIETIFIPKKIKFHVTPKGERFEKSSLDWSYVMPHILLGTALVIGLGFGGYRLWEHGLNFNATLLSAVWTVYNLVILVAAIVVARERPQKRSSPRLFRQIVCELSFGGRTLSGKTADLSETGLSMTLSRPVLLPPMVQVRLISDFGETTEIKGEVIRNDSSPSAKTGGGSGVGIRFLNVNDAQHQSLIRQMYSSPTSWDRVHRPVSSSWRSFTNIATSSVRAFIKEKVLRRFSTRIRKQWACELTAGQRVFKGVTENISNTGISVRLASEEIPSKEVIVRLYHEGREMFSVRGEIVRHTQTKSQGTVYGIRFLERKDLELSSLVLTE